MFHIIKEVVLLAGVEVSACDERDGASDGSCDADDESGGAGNIESGGAVDGNDGAWCC